MILEAERCQLVLVDYQDRLLPHIDQGPSVLAQAVLLAQAARAFGVPVHLTEQSPQSLGSTAANLQSWCPEPLVKTCFDACADGLLEQLAPPTKPSGGGNARSLPKHLRKAVPETKAARDIVVLAGLEAHICVLQTAMGLVEQDIEVWLVTDASGACHSRQKDAALDRMAGQGVELVTAEMVVYEWLGGSDHPQFDEMLAWVKTARAS